MNEITLVVFFMVKILNKITKLFSLHLSLFIFISIHPQMDQKYSQEIVKVYHFRYMREYRAVSVLWAVLTIVWCILNIVCFVQPQWIGDTEESVGYGHMGVYAYCYPDSANTRYICSGSFTDFDTILNGPFKATTFFCGVAALLMLITVAALMLFFCFKKTAVFIFCGILELVCCKSNL